MAYLTGRCRCENEMYIRYGMVNIVSAAEFHRPDSRTVSDWYQSDIGRYIGQHRNGDIKWHIYLGFADVEISLVVPFHNDFSSNGEQLEQR